MALPAIIPLANALLVAAAPTVLTHIMQGFAVNAAIQTSIGVANIKAQNGVTEQLKEVNQKLALVVESVYRSADGARLADVLDEKEFGVRDAVLQVNNIPSDLAQDYEESWTTYTKP